MAYNAIYGRPLLNAAGAVPSTYQQIMKFPTSRGIGSVRGDQHASRKCYVDSIQAKSPPSVMMLDVELPRERIEPLDMIEKIFINEGKEFLVGTGLGSEEKEKLAKCLAENLDVFAWNPNDIPGISSTVAQHRLGVQPGAKPVKQKKRNLAPERQAAARAEVEKLLQAGFIREVQYPEWLANVVLVKKSNGKWRMCVDYTGLNKVCPKDSYPLPRIDQLVDATSGHERLSFLDAFSGYHQISMAEADQEKTSFITDFGTYCYTAMPFGLKNAGVTYQRMVNKVFRGLIGDVVEVYVDDMVVKSARANDHVAYLQKVFDVARQSRLRFNPEKCVFGTAGGKFLGFMITQRGIEVNPDKIRAILEMKSPTSRKIVQRLTGRVAALNRFMSRAADKCYHFFKAIGGSSNFEWTQECEESLRNLKQSLQEPPVLTSPSPGDVLCLYLAVSPKAVSAVLVKEFSKAQKPVYYVSQVLGGAEIRYSLTEQLVFALIVAVRKLRPYFQSHTVQVMTDQPIKQILHRPETSGRLLKWAIELSEFDIEFRPRTAIKAQALADFIVELTTPPELPPGEQADWKIFVDGSSNDEGSRAGIIMIGPNEEELEYSLHFEFPATNNEAEYEAVITGLGLAARLGVTSVEVCSDSQLIIGQVTGEFEAKDGKMAAYLMEVKNLQRGFTKFKITKIPRKDNERADALAKLASANPRRLPRTASVQILRQPSIQHVIDVMNVENEESWIDPLFEYLTKNKLPEDALTAKRLKVRAASFAIIDGQLYKRGFTMPYLKCLRPTEAQETRLEKEKGLWAEELPNVLWAYHTTPRESTGETPFKLAFGMEVVVPVEILSETGRMKVKQPDDAATRGELDLLEGVRDKVAIRMMAYKRRAAEYFNRKVKPRVFLPGDLVLRDAAAAGHPPPKLGPNWEGPYEVIRRLGKGAYSLKDIKGRPLGRPWNAEHHKKYYQ
ncbi:uncharacterized protein LOC111372035 [Olea europaea var. sylvestris]|uniref:uncharacterized protein LOC111372035 n=1 Tax=Olea europaea var. sylvestris TaxID=158386 RepID=UPI000C1CF239|nr:uncharacterized protein LOC111372035 [Olea europaea var. sylvestris]